MDKAVMEKREYVNSVVQEVLADPDWNPTLPYVKVMIMDDVCWDLLNV